MSKQRDYQKRMKAAGRCTQCGKTRERGKELCDKCLEKKALYWHELQRRKAREFPSQNP